MDPFEEPWEQTTRQIYPNFFAVATGWIDDDSGRCLMLVFRDEASGEMTGIALPMNEAEVLVGAMFTAVKSLKVEANPSASN